MKKIEEKSPLWGVFSLALGVISLPICWIPMVAAVPAVVSIILFAQDMKSGYSKAGLLLSLLTMSVQIIYFLIFLFAMVVGGAASAAA